jgi:hypothetical protein
VQKEKVKYIIGGLLTALLVIKVFQISSFPISYQLFALFLAYTACVYLGAALADMRNNILLIESGVSILFFSFACFGLLYSPIWLVLGYTMHGIWDMLHHPRLIKTRIIKWFPPICAVFDFVVAGYIYFSY